MTDQTERPSEAQRPDLERMIGWLDTYGPAVVTGKDIRALIRYALDLETELERSRGVVEAARELASWVQERRRLFPASVLWDPAMGLIAAVAAAQRGEIGQS